MVILVPSSLASSPVALQRENGEEMYQNVQRTRRAIVPLDVATFSLPSLPLLLLEKRAATRDAISNDLVSAKMSILTSN